MSIKWTNYFDSLFIPFPQFYVFFLWEAVGGCVQFCLVAQSRKYCNFQLLKKKNKFRWCFRWGNGNKYFFVMCAIWLRIIGSKFLLDFSQSGCILLLTFVENKHNGFRYLQLLHMLAELLYDFTSSVDWGWFKCYNCSSYKKNSSFKV